MCSFPTFSIGILPKPRSLVSAGQGAAQLAGTEGGVQALVSAGSHSVWVRARPRVSNLPALLLALRPLRLHPVGHPRVLGGLGHRHRVGCQRPRPAATSNNRRSHLGRTFPRTRASTDRSVLELVYCHVDCCRSARQRQLAGGFTLSGRTRLVLGTAAILALFVIGACGDSEEPDSSKVAGSAEPTTSGSPTEACPYVEARPTYLPWLDKGEKVPEPQTAVRNRTSYVAWSAGGDDPSEQKSVVLRRDSEPRGGKGEPVPVRLEGADGYYYAAPESSSTASVLWQTDSPSCDLITLSLSLPGSDQGGLREEILKIVKSLEA